ncbi:DNA gyrase inhibitor YacG [Pararhizobium sp. IMCC21322]|uniref:DNA gyrase inhibitor YacG n=1 Tax=Pararhizobium sp. IMCC21322 TaxID=3067903 RepID=UPI0027410AB3|nr:DNA gyrase inhibitor YacG [Pararhizobium sp. IMCC21322]
MSDNKITPLRKPVPCPICKKLSHRDSYPFCSKHCANVDLGRWFNGKYAVPVIEEDPSSDEFDIEN